MTAAWSCLRATLLGLVLFLVLAFALSLLRLAPSFSALSSLGLVSTLGLPLASLALELAVLAGIPWGFALGLGQRPLPVRLHLLAVPVLVALPALLLAQRLDAVPQAPGLVVAELLRAARTSCNAGSEVVEVPVLQVKVRCSDGVIAGSAPIGRAKFFARELEPSPDLSRLELEGLVLEVPAGKNRPRVRVQAEAATLRGLPPWGRSKQVSGPARMFSVLVAVTVGCLALSLLVGARPALYRGFVGAVAGVALAATQLALDRVQHPLLGLLLLSLPGITGAALAVIAFGLSETAIIHGKSLGIRRRRAAIARAAGGW